MREIIGGRYEFDRATDVIGRGGMGTVYRGRDTQTGGLVAIKQVSSDVTTHNNDFIARFIREADVLRTLTHPNIVTVLDTINDVELGYYLVMEYMGGGSLWDELRSTPLMSIPRVLTIAQNLASALMFVHEKGIIHRDIKPANVLIADDKSPRLCDFGVVHLDDKTRITQTGGIIGTIDYIAPETLNEDKITHKTDIWAFGVMLYEMVAGVRPFSSDSVSALITTILNKQPTNLSIIRPDTPKDLVILIEWMLLKDPSDRVADMSTVHQTLNDIINGTEIITALKNMKPPSSVTNVGKRVGSLPKLFTIDTFHDRAQEQIAITNALAEGRPFIGVYGRGGIGKTGLVSKVLGDFEKLDGANGVAYLRADSTPPMNASSLLDTLSHFLPDDHPFQEMKHDASIATSAKTQTLLDGLGNGRYIVYVDNLETLQHPDTYALTDNEMRQFFETLLGKQRSPMSVIITSRYPIPFPNILKAYETVIRLDDGLPQEDAIQFLRGIDKQGVLPVADDQLKRWIDNIGGYPRGLEALVGYLNGGETRHIDDLLDDPTLFEGEVLSNIVHHIHDALPQDFRQVMAGVAVIGQATGRAELDYLLTPYMDSARLRVILERLVEGRFLSYNRQTRAYSLHPIDRDYALSSTPKGSESDEQTAFTAYILNKRMADYFLARRKPESEWLSLPDIDPQLREMAYRYELGDYDTTTQILLDIDFRFLLVWGYHQLAIQWYTRLQGKTHEPNLAMRSARNFGTAYAMIGDAEMARQKYIIALQMAQKYGDRQKEGAALSNLGIVYAHLGQIEQAIETCQQALLIAREVNDRPGEGRNLSNLGIRHYELGQIQMAIDHYQQALVIAKEQGNDQLEGGCFGELGSILTIDGRYAEAIANLHESIAIFNKMSNFQDLPESLARLARAYWFSGDIPNATTAIQQAREYNMPLYNHMVATMQGCIAFCAGEINKAHTAFSEALEFANALLEKSPKQYEALYSRALAFAGLWVVTGDDTHHINALKAYRDAKTVCGYIGVILDNRQKLEALLRCSDKDGAALVALLQ